MIPPQPTAPAVLARLEAWAAGTPLPTVAETCAVVADEFAALSRDAYRVGDEAGGDRLFARSLAWALAGESGDLTAVRP